MRGSVIASVDAMEGFADNGEAAVIATVCTRDGAIGKAACCAGLSQSGNEAKYRYDKGTRFAGRGILCAVENIVTIAAPALIGHDAANQADCDGVLLALGKKRLGANACAAVSCAVLKAAAASAGAPLYRQLGGVRAFTLPLPSYLGASGSTRYGKTQDAGYAPNYYFVAYDFAFYHEASAALWEVLMNWEDFLRDFLGVKMTYTTGIAIPPGQLEDDFQLWGMMARVIADSGFEGKIGLHADLCASAFYCSETKRYEGIFSPTPKTREDMIEIAVRMAHEYPFVILEDPLEENDFEGFAQITRRTDIQIVGGDLYAANLDRLKQGVAMGAGNAVKIDAAQIGTVTEAAEAARYAYEHGFGLYGGAERGEGWDSCDYAVGLTCATAQNMGLSFAANRLLAIEEELGARARFLGKRALQGRRFQIGRERGRP